MYWPGIIKPVKSSSSRPSVSKANAEQSTKLSSHPRTPSHPRTFSLASSLNSPAQTMAPQAGNPSPGKKQSVTVESVTSGTECDECLDCDECEAIMSPYQALSPPPKGEEAQDIGQEFNPHLPPAPTATYSDAVENLAAAETLPPLPSSPMQQAGDEDSKQLHSQPSSTSKPASGAQSTTAQSQSGLPKQEAEDNDSRSSTPKPSSRAQSVSSNQTAKPSSRAQSVITNQTAKPSGRARSMTTNQTERELPMQQNDDNDSKQPKSQPESPTMPLSRARTLLSQKKPQSASNSQPHGQLYNVSSADLQCFPDEPIGGLTPPRALTPVTITGNPPMPIAGDAFSDISTPQIRLTSPSVSSQPTQVLYQGIRSSTGSVHSLPETAISECSPKTVPYQQSRAATSELTIGDSAREIPTDNAIYEHYNALAAVAESSAMAASRSAEPEQSVPPPMKEKNTNLPEKSDSECSKAHKKKKSFTGDRHTKKLVKECARQAKFEAKKTARVAKHRNSSATVTTDASACHLPHPMLENEPQRVVRQEDGSSESQPNSSYWFNPASSLVSRFRPSPPDQEGNSGPGPSFERMNKISEASGLPEALPTDQTDAVNTDSESTKQKRKPWFREFAKGFSKKGARKARRIALRSFVLKIILGRQVAALVKPILVEISETGELQKWEDKLPSIVNKALNKADHVVEETGADA